MDAPTGLLTCFVQRCQPQLAVAVVGIDVPSLVAARHHMVSGPGILDAYLACHRRLSCDLLEGRCAEFAVVYSLVAAGGELVRTAWVPVVEPSCFWEPEKTRANFRPMSESRTK